MSVIPLVLPESLAVISQHDPKSFLIEAARLQSAHQRTEGSVTVMNCIPVASEFVGIGKRARLGRARPAGREERRACELHYHAGWTAERLAMIFPRRRGQSDYAARAAICDLNSNSMGLT